MADQLLTVAVELDRRAAVKRDRDRRFRARRRAEQRAQLRLAYPVGVGTDGRAGLLMREIP